MFMYAKPRFFFIELDSAYVYLSQDVASSSHSADSTIKCSTDDVEEDLANHAKEGDGIDSGCTATLLINYDDTYKAKK